MKKMIAIAGIILACGIVGLGCDNVNINGQKVDTGMNVYGEPDLVYIDNFCGVDMEFGATYVQGNGEWYWNKIYIRNTNIHGARIIMFEHDVQVVDYSIGWNADQCVNIKGEDGYMHTGCPYNTWLEINSHVEVYVTYWDANYQPVDCPRNGTVFDLDP
ncbi:MAG: hypothetical protein NTX82_05160 [Candidatus Parcubacteria bacterium]|nr:hypothetical protein [Candidatus Parcubacteria bacterium]